jgi:hypothetical protein
MSFTYTGAPSTATPTGRRDAVRLLLKDMSSGSPLYQDSEIEFFLTHFNSNVWRAAAYGAIGLAAREADSKSVGDLSISGFGKSWRDLAAQYQSHAEAHVSLYAGGISVSDKQTAEADTDRVQPAFTRTLFENPLVPQVVSDGTPGVST